MLEEGSDVKEPEPGGKVCNDSTMLGTTNEYDAKNLDPAICDLDMLEGREQVNTEVPRALV